MSLSHFTFSGTPYEQGLAHGEALKESIIKNIEIYVNRFENEAGISIISANPIISLAFRPGKAVIF